MTQHKLDITDEDARQKARLWVERVPEGYQIIFRKDARSTPQNRLMWARLGQIATQVKHPITHVSLPKEWWKDLFLDALHIEQQAVPSLEGTHAVYIGRSSRDLSKETMSALLELIAAFAAKHGVEFRE